MSSETRPGCLTSFEIAALVEDLLPLDQAAAALTHLAGCDSCASALRQARQDLTRDLTIAERAVVVNHLARPAGRQSRRLGRNQQRWAVSAAALLLISAATWYFAFPAESVSDLLAESSAASRPFDFRLPGASYGRVDLQRGAEANPPAALLRAQAALARQAAAGEHNPEFLRLQAWSELLTHQTGAAVRTLEEARRLAPHNLDVVNILGAAYAARAEAVSEAGFRQAVEAFTEVLAARPQDRSALFNRALAYYRQGQTQQAIHDWRALLQVETDEAWIREVRSFLAQAEAKPK
ncbi:MAG: hypothetical protein K2X03_08275 [Bryobacteraceae bacterium]|nr:hypothetical protein [Bryobacteraceae bacterium]